MQRVLQNSCFLIACTLVIFGTARAVFASTDACERIITQSYTDGLWTGTPTDGGCPTTTCDDGVTACDEAFTIGIPNIDYCSCLATGNEKVCNITIQGSTLGCRRNGCAAPCKLNKAPAGSGTTNRKCICP